MNAFRSTHSAVNRGYCYGNFKTQFHRNFKTRFYRRKRNGHNQKDTQNEYQIDLNRITSHDFVSMMDDIDIVNNNQSIKETTDNTENSIIGYNSAESLLNDQTLSNAPEITRFKPYFGYNNKLNAAEMTFVNESVMYT